LDRALDFVCQFLALPPSNPLFLATIDFLYSLCVASPTYLRLLVHETAFVQIVTQAILLCPARIDGYATIVYLLCIFAEDCDGVVILRESVTAQVLTAAVQSARESAVALRSLLALLSAFSSSGPMTEAAAACVFAGLASWSHPTDADAPYWQAFVYAVFEIAQSGEAMLRRMVECGIFPEMLPDVALLDDDAKALRTLLVTFAWAVEDGLLAGAAVPVELFFHYALDRRIRVSGNAVNCLAQCVRHEWAGAIAHFRTAERVLPVCRHVLSEGWIQVSCDAIEVLGFLLAFSAPQVQCQIAAEPFIDVILDLMLLGDGAARVWSIGVIMALLMAGTSCGDSVLIERMQQSSVWSECVDKARDGDVLFADLIGILGQ
jgi:hypothetical protein